MGGGRGHGGPWGLGAAACRRLSAHRRTPRPLLQAKGQEALVAHLTRNVGTAIGLELRDSTQALSAANTKTVKAGMTFNVAVGEGQLRSCAAAGARCVPARCCARGSRRPRRPAAPAVTARGPRPPPSPAGVSGLTRDDAESEQGKSYAILIADTVVVKVGGAPPDVATALAPGDWKDVAYYLKVGRVRGLSLGQCRGWWSASVPAKLCRSAPALPASALRLPINALLPPSSPAGRRRG